MEIKSEYMESTKSLVGKTISTIKTNKVLRVEKWIGQNYLLTDLASGKTGEYPVMVILAQIQKGLMTVKD